MKIDLGLAAIIGSAIIGLSIVAGSFVLAGQSNYVLVDDTGLLDTKTGDRLFGRTGDQGKWMYDRILGPTHRRVEINDID